MKNRSRHTRNVIPDVPLAAVWFSGRFAFIQVEE